MDHLVAVAPQSELIERWDRFYGGRSRKLGQIPVSWDTDRDRAVQAAHDQFRWFGGGWTVNAELPGPPDFAGATAFVRPEDVAESIPCGADVGAVVEAVREFEDAGFTDVAMVQVGDGGQDEFLQAAEKEILPALRVAVDALTGADIRAGRPEPCPCQTSTGDTVRRELKCFDLAANPYRLLSVLLAAGSAGIAQRAKNTLTLWTSTLLLLRCSTGLAGKVDPLR